MGNFFSRHHRQSYVFEAEDWPWVWALRDPEILDWKQGLTDAEVLQQAARQNQMPVAITDNLYLGDVGSSANIPELQKLGIERVLNMAGPLHPSVSQKHRDNNIESLVIDAKDEEGYPILAAHFQKVHTFLQEGRAFGKKTLVHCMAGRNRSVCVLAAHLCLEEENKHRSTTVLETIRHIKMQRGNFILSNTSFQEQLVSFARAHGRLDPEPGTPGSPIQTKPAPLSDQWAYEFLF